VIVAGYGKPVSDLRIGILGAARIAPTALVKPAHRTDGAMTVAVAARDPARARKFARKHGIPRVLDSYRALVEDPEIDAVYNPLPNGLHAQWTVAALWAGKHVLSEKPFTANAQQAREVAAARRAAEAIHGRLVLMEAFHYRYHPLMARVRELAGQLGPISRVEANLCFPLPVFSDIRYKFDLAGGALMDAGCYALHALRHAVPGSGEPVCTGATAKLLRRDRRVDRAMTVDVRYPGGATGRARASMWSSTLLDISARVVGERGEVRVFNFVMPQSYHRVTSIVDGVRRRERVAGQATYTHQLRAFIAAVGGDEGANLTPPEDSIANMTLIDGAYEKAGLPLRP
jgi:predicted dehydrogenase